MIRRRYDSARTGTIALQSIVRGRSERVMFQRHKDAATVVQKLSRTMLTRKRHQKIIRGIAAGQALVRGAEGRMVMVEEEQSRHKEHDHTTEASTKEQPDTISKTPITSPVASAVVFSPAVLEKEPPRPPVVVERAVRQQQSDPVSISPVPRHQTPPLHRLQACARRFLQLRSNERVKAAVRKIQVAYFTWKMEITLLNVESSVVLLQRSVRGQLVRSATRFALNHMNASIRSSVRPTFVRVSDVDRGQHKASRAALDSAWAQAQSNVESTAAVVIQTAARRMLASVRTGQLRGNKPRNSLDGNGEDSGTNGDASEPQHQGWISRIPGRKDGNKTDSSKTNGVALNERNIDSDNTSILPSSVLHIDSKVDTPRKVAFVLDDAVDDTRDGTTNDNEKASTEMEPAPTTSVRSVPTDIIKIEDVLPEIVSKAKDEVTELLGHFIDHRKPLGSTTTACVRRRLLRLEAVSKALETAKAKGRAQTMKPTPPPNLG